MASPFRPALTLLTQYAEYHRDRRNISTHLVGIPLIVLAIGVLLAHPSFAVAGVLLSPAWIVFALACLWYLTRGAFGLGLATSIGIALLMWAAQRLGAGANWVAWGIGLFVAGWALQFIGHYYEGRKPAFVDDIVGLLVGPMFVVFEMLAALGLFQGLALEIERRVGPTHLRDLAQPAVR